jgi:Mu transposase, C-terminal domain
VPADPHLRFETNAYSLDPRLVGRRVEARVSPREVAAVALDTGEQACHERRFAKHRTLCALEHARRCASVTAGRSLSRPSSGARSPSTTS